MSKTKLSFLLLGLMFVVSSASMVSGLVIEEVMVFGEFTNEGTVAGEQLVFTSENDIVGLWFNLTDVDPDDNIIMEFRKPSGELYVTLNWSAPDWIQEGSTWELWEDIEVMGDWRSSEPNIAMTDTPGQWTVDITVNSQLWGSEVYELVSDGKSGSTGSTDDDTKIRGYYIHVKGVSPTGELILGHNATVEVTVEYNFMQVPLVVSILDDQFEPRGTASDEIGDYGESKYSISMETRQGDTDQVFYAVAHYFIDGNWTYMDPGGYMAFTLEGGSSDGAGSIGGIEVPEGFDLSGLDVEKITSTLNDTFQRGLDLLKDVEIPDEITEIEETIKEQTGIPGFPGESILVGVTALGLALRRRE